MNDTHSAEWLTHAYHRMMERVRAGFEALGKPSQLAHHLESAREKAVELGELTREEATRLSDYVQRDLEDAGEHLARSDEQLGAWLRFDLGLIEERVLELFSAAADHTRLALMELDAEARIAPDYHSGEPVSPGTLVCSSCGQRLHFHTISLIPPCPLCHGTAYRRQHGN
jgi:polyhydroxyalkanoate synthesis regulator phasin